MSYDNILNALGQQNRSNPGSYQSQMDNIQTRTDNFRMAEELSNQGTSIKDVLSQIDMLKKKVEALESPKSEVNKEVFAVMEKAVAENPAVIDAKRHLADVKSTIIMELCMKDSRFKEAYDGYKATVNREYVNTHESDKKIETEGRIGAVEIRNDTEGCIQDKESVQIE